MTTYLLDTNIISHLADPLSPLHENVLKNIRSLEQDDVVCVSILSLYEYEYAIHTADKDLSDGLMRTRKTVLDLFSVIPLSLEGSAIYGQLKAHFRNNTGIDKNAIKRHSIDLMIASSSIAAGAVLVSEDKIFQSFMMFHTDFRLERWGLQHKRDILRLVLFISTRGQSLQDGLTGRATRTA